VAYTPQTYAASCAIGADGGQISAMSLSAMRWRRSPSDATGYPSLDHWYRCLSAPRDYWYACRKWSRHWGHPWHGQVTEDSGASTRGEFSLLANCYINAMSLRSSGRPRLPEFSIWSSRGGGAKLAVTCRFAR